MTEIDEFDSPNIDYRALFNPQLPPKPAPEPEPAPRIPALSWQWLTSSHENLKAHEAALKIASSPATGQQLIKRTNEALSIVANEASCPNDVHGAIKLYFTLSLALDMRNIPPALRAQRDHGSALTDMLQRIADILWLQTAYLKDRLSKAANGKRIFSKARTPKRLSLATTEASYARLNGSKEKGKWAYLGPDEFGSVKHAVVRELINISANSATMDYSKVRELLASKPDKTASKVHDQAAIWLCAVVAYGRLSDTAKFYEAITGTPITKQGVSTQLVDRLERDLAAKYHQWKYKQSSKSRSAKKQA